MFRPQPNPTGALYSPVVAHPSYFKDLLPLPGLEPALARRMCCARVCHHHHYHHRYRDRDHDYTIAAAGNAACPFRNLRNVCPPASKPVSPACRLPALPRRVRHGCGCVPACSHAARRWTLQEKKSPGHAVRHCALCRSHLSLAPYGDALGHSRSSNSSFRLRRGRLPVCRCHLAGHGHAGCGTRCLLPDALLIALQSLL